jgi:hypothetical protein
MDLKFLKSFRDKFYEKFEIKTYTNWQWNEEASVPIDVPYKEGTFIQIDELLKEIDDWIAVTFGKLQEKQELQEKQVWNQGEIK